MVAITLHPRLASVTVVSSPKPLDAPVISAVRSECLSVVRLFSTIRLVSVLFLSAECIKKEANGKGHESKSDE
jgi:hypothetical protein